MSTPRGRDLSSVGEIVQPDQSTAGGAKTEERQQVIIDVGVRDLNRLTRQAWQALANANNPPRLFVRGGSCVRIESRPDGAVVVAELTRDRMQHALVHHVSFVRTRKGEQVPEFPPRELLANMLATDNPPLPLLKAVTGVPCLVGDGTLVSEPGFHAPSGVFYAPAAGLVVRCSWCRADASATLPKTKPAAAPMAAPFPASWLPAPIKAPEAAPSRVPLTA